MRHLLLPLLLLPGLGFAAEPVERLFAARIAIDAAGAVTAAEPLGEVDADLADVVRRAATGLAFEPATVDGQPVPSRSTAIVRLRFDPEAPAPRAAEVVQAGHLASPTMPPPRYPQSLMRDKINVLVVLDLAVADDGKVLEEGSGVEHAEARWGKRKVQNAYVYQSAVDATLATALATTLPVEEVDGVPRATNVRLPVVFCFPSDSEGCRILKEAQGKSFREPVEPGVRFARVRPRAATAP